MTKSGLRARWLDAVRTNWNERASQWDAMSEANAAASDRPADLERTANALKIGNGSHVLDAGSGTGQYALAFAQLGCAVTAVDIASEMVTRAKQHSGRLSVNIDWRVGDISAVDVADSYFDAIHARVVLQFVPDVSATLSEFQRILKPEGRLYASVPGSLSPIYNRSVRRFLEPEFLGSNYITPWELEAVLEALGWKILDGWGSYGQNLSGDKNPVTAESVAHLHPKLQQAAATTWAVIAEP